MSRVFAEPVIQPLTSLSEKARPSNLRKPSHIEPYVLEQWAFVLALDLKRRERVT
jgi:hypothetical protein